MICQAQEAEDANGRAIIANQYEELIKLALFCANQARTGFLFA